MIETEPDGAALVDREDQDRRVASWGAWHAQLAEEPGLLACTVTIETAPATASRLRDTIERRIDPHAPSLAKEIMAEIVERSPHGAADITGYIALTYAIGRAGRRRSLEDAAVEIASRLPGLTHGLQATGAGIGRPVSAQRLCEIIRVAYDPGSAVALEQARTAGQVPRPEWSDVGPAQAVAEEDCYHHDSGWSMTWAMSDAPRGEFRHTVLSRLLQPDPEIDRKRVTLIYRPVDPGAAQRIVEEDIRDAEARVNWSQRPSARARLEQRQAQRAAEEVAGGAGLEDFAMLVTATVTDREQLIAARDAVERSAGAMALRLLRGTQPSAFAGALPLGLVLSAHLQTPKWLQGGL